MVKENRACGFNEAPAKRGGNGRPAVRRGWRCRGFNEAPAKRGGNGRLATEGRGSGRQASMRPPRNAGEMAAWRIAAVRQRAELQ